MSQHELLVKLEDRLSRPESDLSHLTAEEQHRLILAKVASIPGAVISPDDLLDRLRTAKKTGCPLRVKFGIDPTGPDIHIGHAVSLINLRLMQRMGHQVVIVIGDFTGMIGDPSGRSDSREALTIEDVHRNMASYEQQAARIINLRDTAVETHYNSTWMNRLTMAEWIDLIKKISATALLQREDFRNRLAAGRGLTMAELEYALFMAYDSVVLKPDIEIGGIDQYLNMHMCRQMMANEKLQPEVVITYNLLAGTTGERDDQGRLIKMSKSRGNYIPVETPPADMYGRVMAIPDEVMWIWFRELTEITAEELDALKEKVEDGTIHPKSAKQLLARLVVGTFNRFDATIMREAEEVFESKFGKAADLVPRDVETLRVSPEELMLDVLSRVTSKSKSDIRRLVQQNGVQLLSALQYVPLDVSDLSRAAECYPDCVLRIGKRQYFRLVVEKAC